MLKLTPKLKLNLQVLANEQYIEICTSAGRAFGKILSSNEGGSRPTLTTLNTFFAWGLLDQEERFYHGLRYSRLSISDKGNQALRELEVINE
jgi:hypothetical protein